MVVVDAVSCTAHHRHADADIDHTIAYASSYSLVTGMSGTMPVCVMGLLVRSLSPAFAYGFMVSHYKVGEVLPRGCASKTCRPWQASELSLSQCSCQWRGSHNIVEVSLETCVVLITQLALSKLQCTGEIYTAVQKRIPQIVTLSRVRVPYGNANAKFDMIRYSERVGKALVQLGIIKAILHASFEALLALYYLGVPLIA